MYTKEDIEKAKQYLDNEGYGTGSNFTLNVVANLMAEYAAKNCVIPAVMVELPENHVCRYSKAMNQPYPRLCVDCGKPEGN